MIEVVNIRQKTGRASRPPATVLVVDDDEDMRFYVRGCLGKLGLKDVVEASNGVEALRIARGKEIALVVSDVAMPEMDGYELCRTLKADPTLNSVPVLLISGESGEPPPDVRADAFLPKPFNAARLWASVADLLDFPS